MTTLTGLMLTLIWAGDLGNHVRESSEESQLANPGSCSTESKEAISHLSTSDEYSGDGTQIEKVLIKNIFTKTFCCCVVLFLNQTKQVCGIGKNDTF